MEGALGLERTLDANNNRPEGSLRESRRVEGRIKWPVIDSVQGKFPLSTVVGIHLGPLYPHTYHQRPVPIKVAKRMGAGGLRPGSPRRSLSDLRK